LKTGKAAVQIAQKQRKRRLEGRERSLLVGILLFAGKLRTGKSKADRAIKLSLCFYQTTRGNVEAIVYLWFCRLFVNILWF